jgi:hypothetical protein
VIWQDTNASEGHAASIFRVEMEAADNDLKPALVAKVRYKYKEKYSEELTVTVFKVGVVEIMH